MGRLLSEIGCKHPLYRTWESMKGRCYNPNNTNYPNYGGRGIKVCDEWKNNFQAFAEYMGERPPNMTMDRINNDGDYEPGNVRWATTSEQLLNRRNVPRTWAAMSEEDVKTIRNVFNRGTRTYQQLADDYGVSFGTIGKIVRKERYKYVSDSPKIYAK